MTPPNTVTLLNPTTLNYTVGDTIPSPQFQYGSVDPNTGLITPANITGYGFVLAFSPGNLVSKTAVITDAANGKFQINWLTGDLAVPGQWPTRITMTTPSADIQSFQNFSMIIKPRIGG